ncbi:MAG: DinB family protein [Phycisphaerales bacterium JB037]
METGTPIAASQFTRTSLEVARGAMLYALEKTPDQAMLVQLVPGGIHPTWMLGHLAVIDDEALTWLAGVPRALPESWHDQFGMGSTVTDEGAYPTRDELIGAMADRRAALLDWLDRAGDADLLAPASGRIAECAPNKMTMLLQMSLHEGMHLGQLVMARRAAGLERIFG